MNLLLFYYSLSPFEPAALLYTPPPLPLIPSKECFSRKTTRKTCMHAYMPSPPFPLPFPFPNHILTSHLPLNLLRLPLRRSTQFTRLPLRLARHLARLSFRFSRHFFRGTGHFFGGAAGFFRAHSYGGFEGLGCLFWREGRGMLDCGSAVMIERGSGDGSDEG